ncbi:MAG: hypothetical protein ACREHC_07380 [Candidatus Levyibacteriota bacterium]
MLRNRSVQIALGVIILLVIGVGGYFIVAGSKAKPVEDQTVDENLIQTLSPKDIGLTLEPSSDKKKVKFKIAKASDIKSVEYELTYEADSTKQEISDGGDARVQRGITGEANVDGAATYESDYLILGSQSATVVRYDTGVKSVKLTLKVTKSNNKVYQVIDNLTL